jgi:2-hydroxy-6-oxonona-2,4-dienedioate hydrolase
MSGAEEARRALQALGDSGTRLITSDLAGAQVVWRRWGQGRPIVLLHGGAGTWMHWAKNIAALAQDRTVYAPDMPGFGESDRPEDTHDADTVAPHVLRGMLELIEEPFDLVGFSFGALVSSMVAAQAPAILERLVVVSVAGMGLTARPEMKSMRGVTDAAGRAEVYRFNLAAMMLHDPATVDDMAVLIQDAGVSNERLKNRSQVRQNILPGLLKQCRCKTFGIWGTEDAVYRQHFAKLRETVPKLGLQDHTFMEGAGHWLPYERPEDFKAILDRYLRA